MVLLLCVAFCLLLIGRIVVVSGCGNEWNSTRFEAKKKKKPNWNRCAILFLTTGCLFVCLFVCFSFFSSASFSCPRRILLLFLSLSSIFSLFLFSFLECTEFRLDVVFLALLYSFALLFSLFLRSKWFVAMDIHRINTAIKHWKKTRYKVFSSTDSKMFVYGTFAIYFLISSIRLKYHRCLGTF